MTRPRRDPRQARAACAVAGGRRPRFDLQGPASPRRRPRRSPWEEREARRVCASARPRFDVLRADLAPHLLEAPARAVAAAEPVRATIVLADPAFHVLVVPDTANGNLTAHDRQLLGAARILAGDGGAVVALTSEDCRDLEAAGADRRVAIPTELLGVYDPEARAAIVVETIAALSPRHVLFAETGDGGDLARRVATLTGEAMFADAEAVTQRLVRRPARNRRVEQSVAPPRLVTISPGAVASYGGAPREARRVDIERAQAAGERAGPILDARFIRADPATVPLVSADFVAAAGNGVTDFPAFQALAAALRATPGASRVLCDAGVMPRDRQVGASGTVLAATCYLALGIAGAPQHLQGVADCQHVIAVNTDLHAAMIERADLAIVQDAQLVMPALLAALAERAGKATEDPA